MAYLDSAGNVDSVAGPVVAQWQAFHRQQAALFHVKVTPAVPASSPASGSEKACKGSN